MNLEFERDRDPDPDRERQLRLGKWETNLKVLTSWSALP